MALEVWRFQQRRELMDELIYEEIANSHYKYDLKSLKQRFVKENC